MCGEMYPACGCLKPRAGAIIVGALDVIIGSVGIGFTCLLLYGNRIEERDLKYLKPPGEARDETINRLNAQFWYFALTWLFPAVITFVLGVLLTLGAAMNNFCLTTISVVMNIMLIIGSAAIFFIMMFFQTPWLITIPVIIAAFLQMYFLWIVQDFRYTVLKPVFRYV